MDKYPQTTKSTKKPHYTVAAGIIWNKKMLLVSKRRERGLLGGLWEFPGGKIKPNESPRQCVLREIKEELGSLPDIVKTIPIEKFTHNKNNFIYETFVNIIEEEFIPDLNHEHVGYAWVDIDHFPKPLHPGLYNTLNIDAINEKLKTLISQYIT